MFKFNLGDEVKDIITGYKGIVQARGDYLTGCNRYGIVTQKLNSEGKPADWIWFDENVLQLVKANKVKLIDENKSEIRKKPYEPYRDRGGPLRKDQIPNK